MPVSNNQLTFQISQETGRIDKVLSEQFRDYTRSVIQQWLKQGAVRVNEVPVKANYKVRTGDQITILIPQEEELVVAAEDIPLEIIFEDADLVVVNKPSGMVVHPSKGHSSGTLVNALLHHIGNLSTQGESFRPGIVHRIDKDTSGLLVVAKTPKAHLALSKQLEEHTMQRTYLAIVEGHFAHESGTIDAPLGRSTSNRLKRSVQKNGRAAVTHFTVIETLRDASLLSLQLETGRTHQIRAHMDYIQHPILNDPMYHPASKQATSFGQYLHAKTLGFVHPTSQETMSFEVEPPREFLDKLEELRFDDL